MSEDNDKKEVEETPEEKAERIKKSTAFDASMATKIGEKDDVIKKLVKIVESHSKDKLWLMVTAGIILLTIAFVSTIIIISVRKERNSFVHEYMKTEQIRNKDNAFRNYVDLAINGRQVFAFHWYIKYASPFGPLNMNRTFAMDLRAYNKMLDMMWEFNEYIGCGENEQFNILSQLIFESALNELAEHTTGEIVRFAGYTKAGLMYALWVYKEEMRIDSGSPFYISEIYQRHPNYDTIFSKWENVLKFHYSFMWWKKRKYHGRWDCMLTSYNQGEDRVDAWDLQGLDRIPNKLLSRKHKLWLREYYQTIFEIRSAIASGNLQRMSRAKARMDKVVRKMSAYRKDKLRYIKTVRLKFREADKAKQLEESLGLVKTEFDNYKKTVDEYMNTMSKLNDVNYQINVKKMKTKYTPLKNKLVALAREQLKEIERLKKNKSKKLIFRIVIIFGICAVSIAVLVWLSIKLVRLIINVMASLGIIKGRKLK